MNITIDRTVRQTTTPHPLLLPTLAMALAALAPPAFAAEEAAPAKSGAPAPAKAEKGDSLPLHQIEGNGGIFATLSAYIVNPPREGEPIGRPASDSPMSTSVTNRTS